MSATQNVAWREQFPINPRQPMHILCNQSKTARDRSKIIHFWDWDYYGLYVVSEIVNSISIKQNACVVAH